jgi:hypothetical protein
MLYIMSDKKEIQEPGLDTEEAKETRVRQATKTYKKSESSIYSDIK